jgi:hypothetical protein
MISRIGLVSFAALISLVASHSEAQASSSNGFGKIVNVLAASSGAVEFELDQSFFDIEAKVVRSKFSRDALPACASGKARQWAVDASTEPGKALLTTLLWAVERQAQISVVGTGKCTISADVETVAEISVQ